jgi:hypothetical protein
MEPNGRAARTSLPLAMPTMTRELTADDFSANESFMLGNQTAHETLDASVTERRTRMLLHLIQQFRLRPDGQRCLKFTTSCRQWLGCVYFEAGFFGLLVSLLSSQSILSSTG